jgi:putative transposase
MVLQELIELVAPEKIGATRYERTASRVTERNGARPRALPTQAGDVQLRIPELRKGSFFRPSSSHADASTGPPTRW